MVRKALQGRDPTEPMPAGVELTDEQEYNWDLSGYLLLPSAGLSAGTELTHLVAGYNPEGTALMAVLARLCCNTDSAYDFGGFELDGPVRDAHLAADATPAPLEGGTGEGGQIVHARSYFNSGGHRFVHGIRVVWCLGGSSCYTVIPGSHKSTAETPEAVRTGEADDMLNSLGLLQQPPLRAGDVLVVAASALQGLRHPTDQSNGGPARYIIADFSSKRSRSPTALTDPTPPLPISLEQPWATELTDVQRVILGLDPHAVVKSDGTSAWLDPGADPITHHPWVY